MMIKIREASKSDVRAIVHNNLRLALESEGIRLDEQVVRKGVDAVISDPMRGFYLVAEDGGEIVGQCLVTPEWSDWRDGYFWWIQSVYVEKEMRNRGILSMIFERVHELAEKRGIVGIRLYVDRENMVAISAYERLGMIKSRYLMMEGTKES